MTQSGTVGVTCKLLRLLPDTHIIRVITGRLSKTGVFPSLPVVENKAGCDTWKMVSHSDCSWPLSYITSTTLTINKLFIFMKQKSACGSSENQLVIESSASYYSKLTTQKLPNTTMKKKKSYMIVLNLLKICFFFHQTIGTNHFLRTVKYCTRKK